MTIKQFQLYDKSLFYAFTKDAFAKMREAKSRVLIIDVRQNGGGDDDMWMEGILPYIATAPYRHTSTYIKKVISGRESATEKLGAIIHGEQTKWEQPVSGHPLRFQGQTYVLVGRMTYSSSVLFSNVMQDFGFGRLVGERGFARTRQSGGTQYKTLPNSGLGIVVPRFVLERPAGSRPEHPLIRPDIVLPDSPFDSRALIDALLARIRQSR